MRSRWWPINPAFTCLVKAARACWRRRRRILGRDSWRLAVAANVAVWSDLTKAKTPAISPGLDIKASRTLGRYFRLVFRGFPQYITASPDRFDVILAARGVGELFAELADEHINDFQLRLVHAAIEMVEEHLLGQGRTFAQAQEFQHLVLLAGEVHARTVDLDGLGVEIDDQVSRLDDGLGVTFRPTHN